MIIVVGVDERPKIIEISLESKMVQEVGNL
jgi:hypothetical protein